jgi:hypothetical protein
LPVPLLFSTDLLVPALVNPSLASKRVDQVLLYKNFPPLKNWRYGLRWRRNAVGEE